MDDDDGLMILEALKLNEQYVYGNGLLITCFVFRCFIIITSHTYSHASESVYQSANQPATYYNCQSLTIIR